mmetsp:Transcript_5917/g.17739  ORF Transcript_5917/g.17739 Transcript_5917/m.17739 type:complete len:854 (+) Transcript_5917:392-2953(+)
MINYSERDTGTNRGPAAVSAADGAVVASDDEDLPQVQSVASSQIPGQPSMPLNTSTGVFIDATAGRPLAMGNQSKHFVDASAPPPLDDMGNATGSNGTVNTYSSSLPRSHAHPQPQAQAQVPTRRHGHDTAPDFPRMQPQHPHAQQSQHSKHLRPPTLASLPWTVGSTDGIFATMTIRQTYEQQRRQQPQQAAQSARNADLSSEMSQTKTQTEATGAVIDSEGQASTNVNVSVVGRNENSKATNIAASTSNDTNSPSNHAILASLSAIQSGKSLYHDMLFRQPSSSVESVLSASCDIMGFDIAEMWLRTGPKTHQLTNSHLRPTALEDSVRQELVDVYYGEKSSERTHRLSPALCKRAKDANDVVWVTALTPHGAQTLRCSISNVRTAVAVPVCHEASNTNITIIYFSIRRIVMRPTAIEFLVHVSLAAAVASVSNFAVEGVTHHGHSGNLPFAISGATSQQQQQQKQSRLFDGLSSGGALASRIEDTGPSRPDATSISRSEHTPRSTVNRDGSDVYTTANAIRHQRVEKVSVTGAQLTLQWRQLHNVEYLTDGGNSWIHTAVFNGKPVVVKTLKPECQDVVMAINEIEGEVAIHSRLNHPNIVGLIGAGSTSKGVRFVVLERLDGGTLTQMLGYDTRIRDRRRRFWKKKTIAYLDVLRYAKSIAMAMQYCHEEAIPGSVVLHRDLKPDNIGFTLNGTVKVFDFGLARQLENADAKSDDVYAMSGETGSLRYMSPEVASCMPYSHKADVYSFGIILWEMNAAKKPFGGLSRDTFYDRVIQGGERPQCNKKWPEELSSLIKQCWDAEPEKRPNFATVVDKLDALLAQEKEGASTKSKNPFRRISGMIDRHSTWF